MVGPSTASPLPVITPRLQWLIGAGIEVGTVLDAGVQHGTPFLQKCFPAVRHLLFEPISAYFPSIERSYADFDCELFPVALSDTDGSCWQLGFSGDGSGKVTSSRISESPKEVGSEAGLVSCTEVKKLRLDTLLQDRQERQPYLLKVDVDGHELPVLRGAQKTLASCSVVVLEAAINSIGTKVQLMAAAGLELVDIVDLCYYHGSLSQVDLVFVHVNCIARCPDLRPWRTKPFSWDAWAPLSRNALLQPGL
jgi:FkbM family methyltransferase